MALTREFIRNAAKESGVEIPKEMEDALIHEHLSARDAYAGEQVKAALEENKPEPAPAVKDTQEYKDLEQKYQDLKGEFKKYKTDQTAKETYAAKEKAYRAILKAANINEKRYDTVLRAAKADGIIDAIELDETGNAKNADALTESAKTDWADFVLTTETTGAVFARPPVNTGGKPTMTVEEIDSISNAAERQAAMAQNLDLYGIK